jgi:hypothetical protein
VDVGIDETRRDEPPVPDPGILADPGDAPARPFDHPGENPAPMQIDDLSAQPLHMRFHFSPRWLGQRAMATPVSKNYSQKALPGIP